MCSHVSHACYPGAGEPTRWSAQGRELCHRPGMADDGEQFRLGFRRPPGGTGEPIDPGKTERLHPRDEPLALGAARDGLM
jgi:hypothetical protein